VEVRKLGSTLPKKKLIVWVAEEHQRKIQNERERRIFFKVQHHISYVMPIKLCHFKASLIW
jgi:hypothetical protein